MNNKFLIKTVALKLLEKSIYHQMNLYTQSLTPLILLTIT